MNNNNININRPQLNRLVILLTLAVALTGCTVVSSSATDGSGTRTSLTTASGGPAARSLRILTTNRMLQQIVRLFTSDYHTVDTMVNAAATLKTFTPYYRFYEDGLYDSFLYLGADYEPFIDKFLEGVDRNALDVVNLSRGIDIARYKVNKLDKENYYYLTNSTNYKIVLSSIKNNLLELDNARKKDYEGTFDALSKEIDKFQKKIRSFMEANKNIRFISDNEMTQYISQEYKVPHINIMDFKADQEKGELIPGIAANASNATKAATTANATKDDNGNNKTIDLFLYTEDVAISKYADDINKYQLTPVKIKLYDYSRSLLDLYESNYQAITAAAIKMGAQDSLPQ